MTLNDLPDFILLNVFEFLDVISLVRVQRTSKRNYVYSQAVINNSSCVRTIHGVNTNDIKNILNNHSSLPTFMIIVGEKNDSKIGYFAESLPKYIPPSTPVIIAKCTSILKPRRSTRGHQFNFFSSQTVEDITSGYSTFIASLPGTTIGSFYFRDVINEGTAQVTDESLQRAGLQNINEDWEVIVVYASHCDYIDTFIASLQQRYPSAVIVGGICQQVTMYHHGQFFKDNDSIACLALKGRVPLRTIVSRGHTPVSKVYHILPEHMQIGDESPFIMVSDLIENDTNETVEPRELLSQIIRTYHGENRLFMIGLRSVPSTTTTTTTTLQSTSTSTGVSTRTLPSAAAAAAIDERTLPGFSLQLMNNHTIIDSYMILDKTALPSLPNQLQIYMVNQESCETDLHMSLALAKQKFQEERLDMLGTLMFTCSGRGPHNDFFDECDYDATVFKSTFPHTPILGCYVDGEIGPQLHAGISRISSYFATSETQCSVQGFTAVFCMLAVPARRSIGELLALIHQSSSNILTMTNNNNNNNNNNNSSTQSSAGTTSMSIADTPYITTTTTTDTTTHNNVMNTDNHMNINMGMDISTSHTSTLPSSSSSLLDTNTSNLPISSHTRKRSKSGGGQLHG